MPTQKVDHDQLFKNLLRSFFREFMELFFPDEAGAMDFRRIEFLDKEHFTDVPKGSQRELDLVVKVGLHTGDSEFVLVHTEFESSKPSDFAERMYCYYAQLYLRHKKPIVPIALFADDAVWRKDVPREFRMGFLKKTYLRYTYRSLKLKNLSHRAFLRRDNPISFALMAKMQYDRREMVRLKAEFLRLIAGAKVNEARRGVLFEFVETYMKLEPSRQAKFDRLIEVNKEFREVRKMVTVYEKRGIKKGIEKGIQKGSTAERKRIAKRLLAEGMAPKDVARCTGLTLSQIQKLT